MQLKKLIQFPIIFLPWTLVLSKFFAELFVVLICLYSIIILSQNFKKEVVILNNFFSFLFIFFSLYIFLNSVISNSSYEINIKSLLYFRYYFFILGIFFIIRDNPKIIKLFFLSLTFLIIFLLIGSIYELVFSKNILSNSLIDPLRISSFFGDELIMGSFLVRIMPLYLSLFFFLRLNTIKNNAKFSNKKYILLFLILIFPFLIFLSGERTAVGLFIISIIYLTLTIKFNKFFIFKLIFFITLIFSMLLLFNPNFKQRLILDTFNDLTRVDTNISKVKKMNLYFFSVYHTNYFLTSKKMFEDNILFGQGPRSYRFKCSEKNFMIDTNSCANHPHNYYIQLLAETGLIGFLSIFLLFIILVIKSLKLPFRKKFYNNHKTCLMCGFFISLWPIVPTGSFFNSWLSIISFLPVGFYLFYRLGGVIKKNES